MSLDDTLTPNAKLAEIVPARPNWADAMNNNMILIDAIIGSYFAVNQLQGVWKNSTQYVLNDAVVDTVSGIVYKCQVAHTSAAFPTLFSADRLANPTFWFTYTSPARARGAWLPNTAYTINDFVSNGSQFAICIKTHTSSANFANDVAAGDWSILVDLSAAGSLVLPILTGAADANKFVSTNAAGLAYIILTTAQALANLGGTSLGISVFQAASQGAALTALGAQPVGSYQAANSTLTALSGNPTTAFGISILNLTNAAALQGLVTPLTTRGDFWIRNAANADARLALGGFGQRVGVSGSDIAWIGTPASDVRQTQVCGPVDANGVPSFLPGSSGSLTLTEQNISGSYPCILTAANGWSSTDGSPVDNTGVSTANQSWNLANNSSLFLYKDIGAGGALTPGSGTLAPIYQQGGTPSIVNGQFTFNIGEMRGYVGNGAAAVQTNRVYVGEAVTAAGLVTSTVMYAYNGRYFGASVTPLPVQDSGTQYIHNLGIYPRVAGVIVECITNDGTWVVGDQLDSKSCYTVDAGTGTIPISSPPILMGKKINVLSVSFNSFGAVVPAGNTNAALTRASWKYYPYAYRGWGGAI